MKEYDTWSFRNRSFMLGMAVSLVWHFFWFFAVIIVISPAKKKVPVMPKVISLGRVLDDTIFRTLVETRPQLSETFYRQPSDFSELLQPKAQAIERHSPGDVVSVPFGKKFLNSLRVLVSGGKMSPDYEFISRINIGYTDAPTNIDGEAAGRQIVSRPEEPQVLTGLDAVRKKTIEIRFVVDSAGAVRDAEVTRSCGNPNIEALWLRYLRRWQFAPLEGPRPADQEGVARFRAGGREDID